MAEQIIVRRVPADRLAGNRLTSRDRRIGYTMNRQARGRNCATNDTAPVSFATYYEKWRYSSSPRTAHDDRNVGQEPNAATETNVAAGPCSRRQHSGAVCALPCRLGKAGVTVCEVRRARRIAGSVRRRDPLRRRLGPPACRRRADERPSRVASSRYSPDPACPCARKFTTADAVALNCSREGNTSQSWRCAHSSVSGRTTTSSLPT